MKKSVRRWFVAVPLIAWVPAVFADATADGDQLAEIVVTAQKRAESLQTVPVSITTFGTQELKDRAVESFMDYATSVPNLGFGASGDGAANSRTISIRGVSGDNTTGFYLDETPLPDLVNNLTYSYVGESKSANNNPFNPRTRSPYALLDARCALAFGRNEVALVGKNLTNEHANLADNRSIAVELPGRPRIVTNQPITIGIEFRSTFQ